MAKQIDTTVEIERAYIKDKITYQKVRNKKTTYFYDVAATNNANGKCVVALVYPFNYNATPFTPKKPEFNISWGDGSETVIKYKYVDMFSLHFDKIKKFTNGVDGIEDFKLFPVDEKTYPGAEKLLYHEYELNNNGMFKVNGKNVIRISIESDEIVIPVSMNIEQINRLSNFLSGSNLNVSIPEDERVFDDYNVYSRSKLYLETLSQCISFSVFSIGGEYPPNLIGLPTEEYREDFSNVFKRGIFHPLDQKITHTKNGTNGIDNDIMSSINTNERSYVPDYKSPGSMSMYALAGNNRFINKELLESIGKPKRHPIPIQAYLCSGVITDTSNHYYVNINRHSRGLNINPLLTPALINKGVNINNSILRITVTTATSDKSKVHSVFNPYQNIIKVFPNYKGEFKLFSNTETEEMWGFFCNFYKDWRYIDPITNNAVTSPWLYDTDGLYDLFKSIPETVKSMKCVFRVHQSFVDEDIYGIKNRDRILDAIPKTVQEIENLVVFSNISFYKKKFREYRNAHEYDESEAYDGRFRMLPFDNDDGKSSKYKNSKLRVIKNMVFCCDLYPEPLRLNENTWTTNFDGVSLLYGFNSLEKVDGVFTYCRFKDTGYMRIRDICQRPNRNKYEDPSAIDFKLIELSRVMHWCDVINELSEDGDGNDHALNPFNGHMVNKQRSSWNITPNYKYREFFNAMTGESNFNPDKAPTFIFGKQENDIDLKKMGMGFLFIEREVYKDDRLGGMVDQSPIFKSVTDFAHGYMMSYSYINSEIPAMDTKTIKIDGYIQQFYNHLFMEKVNYKHDWDFSKPRASYVRNYCNAFINIQWLSPLGWMLIGNTIDINKKVPATTRRYVKNKFRPAIINLTNMEGMFSNIGALACDLTPMNEVCDYTTFLDQEIVVSISGQRKTIHLYSNRFGLYSYNEDDILIRTDKDININRIFQNETYYAALATDNFYQAKGEYVRWFNDESIYRDNEVNKLYGYEHHLCYPMTTFKNYLNLTGSDYKDKLISMGLPTMMFYYKPLWVMNEAPSYNEEYSYTRLNCALGEEKRFNSPTTQARDDNLLNWIVPPITTGFKYRYPTLYHFINQKYANTTRITHRHTMNTIYPRSHQGANFLLTKGNFIVNINNSSVSADYAFDGMILHFGLNKAIIHKDFIISSMKGITTKNTIGVIKHNCDWNFKNRDVIAYIPTISKPFTTMVTGEPFTNLKYIIPKKIIANLDEFNECVALRMVDFDSFKTRWGVVNSMVVPKIATTPSRYRKFDNIQYRFKEDIEIDEFNFLPTNAVDYYNLVSNTSHYNEGDIYGILHVRKLFPDDVNVHIKNFKLPYNDNIEKFRLIHNRTENFHEKIYDLDHFIKYSVPLKYALNGAVIDNLEEIKSKWSYVGTPAIFKSGELIDTSRGQRKTAIFRCPYNIDLTKISFKFKPFIMSETDWYRQKINEKNIVLQSGPLNNNDFIHDEYRKLVANVERSPGYEVTSQFQSPLRQVVLPKHMGTNYSTRFLNKNGDNDHSEFSPNDSPDKLLFPTSQARNLQASDWLVLSADENMGGTSRWVNQLPKNLMGTGYRVYSDRIEVDIDVDEVEHSILILSEIPLWMEGSDYITGEFPPYSDYSEKFPIFKTTPIDEDWFKTQCFDKQKKGFEIDDVFLELDEHMKLTLALMQIDNNDLNIPHRVNPYILEPTTYKGQTKFGEIINAYGRKFPIVNFRWTLGFAFSNLPKTVTEVDGFNFADTVYVPDKCVPEQITKFHFHKELLEPNQAYKEGIVDAVLWFNKPFINENIEMVNSVEYFSNIMLFTRRKDSLSNGARTQMEEYYEWSTDNKITLGPLNFNEGYGHWKPSIKLYGNSSTEGHHINLGVAPPEPNYYEMRRNYTKWVVADRNVKADDIITVKWVVRFQSDVHIGFNHETTGDYTNVILNPYICTGNGRFDMSEDIITYTGKAKDLPNFSVFDYSNIPVARQMLRQRGLPYIKSIRIYGDVYVCPAINWERGLWGVLRGTLPSGTDTRCVPIPQRCYEGIFYRDVKLHGIITGEYDGSLPEKLFWGTRNENLRIQGLYCSTRYANPHSWHTRKRNIRKPLIAKEKWRFGSRGQDNALAYVKHVGKVVADNLSATLDNIFQPDSYHNIYNRLTGNQIYVPNIESSKSIFPMVTSENDSDYPSTIENIYNINYEKITDDLIDSGRDTYYPKNLFYLAGFTDRFNYKPIWNFNRDVLDSEQETAYSYDFSRGAFSNVHDASPLSIPHKIDELDVSYLGGFADLYEVYTDDVFGFTEPNLYNFNYANFQKVHMEEGYIGFREVDYTTDGGVWNSLTHPSYPCVPVSSFFGKWFFLNGTIRVKDNSDAYVFSDHRIGHIIDFDGYSPHRFDQTCFDQSIYAVQHENVRRQSIYKISATATRMSDGTNRFYMNQNGELNYYNALSQIPFSYRVGYWEETGVTHGGFGAIERYSRASIFYPSDLISETVGNIVETGYTPIMSSLMKLTALKWFRNEINRGDIMWYSTIPKECLVPQGYQTNWSVADEDTMLCPSLVLKRLKEVPYKNTIIQPPKWYSSNISPAHLHRYGAERFKYQNDILENPDLKVSVVTCEPAKNMLMRLNGKRRIKVRYGRLRNVDYTGKFWITPNNGELNENHIIYQRAIPGIVQLMYYRNSAYSGRLENVRNLAHWASGGFNYGLIDDTGMTQFVDLSREFFIESETGFAHNQMLIGCHPHLKEVKIINACNSELNPEYYNKLDKPSVPNIDDSFSDTSDIWVAIKESSQHPSYNQTSCNCFIRETLPYQPCLTKIINCSSSPLYLTVGDTSLTHILTYGRGVFHGRKFGKDENNWTWIMGEEEKVMSMSTNMRTAIFPTWKKGMYKPTSNFTGDPISQVSSYVNVIVDNKWVNRKMYARSDKVGDSKYLYDGIKVQGTFLSVWTNPHRHAWNESSNPATMSRQRYFDVAFLGNKNHGVSIGPNRGFNFEYSTDAIINLHQYGYSRRLTPVTMKWWGKYEENIPLPNDYYLGMQMGQVGKSEYRESGNPYHNPNLKVLLTHTFANYYFATWNQVDLHSLCDKSIFSSGDSTKVPEGIIVKDDYRYTEIIGQPDTIVYGKETPVIYCNSQKGWFLNSRNLLNLSYWEADIQNLPTNWTKPLLWILEGDSDISDFYRNDYSSKYGRDFAKMSFYSAYEKYPDAHLPNFEASIIRFKKSSYPSTDVLNITNAFNPIRLRWFNYDLGKDAYRKTLDKYKFNVQNYVRDNFDRIFFSGKINIIGKSGIYSNI